MMNKLLILLLLIPMVSSGGFLNPDDYDECVFDLYDIAKTSEGRIIGEEGCRQWFLYDEIKHGKCLYKVAKKSKTRQEAIAGNDACNYKYTKINRLYERLEGKTEQRNNSYKTNPLLPQPMIINGEPKLCHYIGNHLVCDW